MKLDIIKKMVASAIVAEKEAAEAAKHVLVPGHRQLQDLAVRAFQGVREIIAEARKADTEAQFVLRTCAEIAIGDRLGAFERAPEEMRLGMEHARLREYVALLDPVNSADDADRFEAVILCLANYFGAEDVEEILFGEEAGTAECVCVPLQASAVPSVIGVLTDPFDYLYN